MTRTVRHGDGVDPASPARLRRQAHQPNGTTLHAIAPALAVAAERQNGVLTRAQLHAHGFTRRQIDSAIAAKRWQAFGRSVVVLHNAALSPGQQHWVAVLLFTKPAAVAGLSAATIGGLRGFAPTHVHVVVDHSSRVGLPHWVRLHESHRFGPAAVRNICGLPVTRLPRAVVDAATWSRYPRRACAILCAAVQQRLVTADLLARELRRAGPVRHCAIMRAILGDIAGGGHTLAEIDLGPLAQRAGLPPPRRQQSRREPSGRVRYLDAEFELANGTVLVVEIDGAAHMQHEQWSDDLDRQNEIIIGKRPILRFPSVVIRLEEGRVVDQLTRLRLAYS